MNVQTSSDSINKSFILDASLTASRSDLTLLQDAGRATDLLFGTVLAKVAATGKYVPLTDVAAVDGSALPAGIYIGADVLAADLVAGDVVDSKILLGGDVFVDKNRIVFEAPVIASTVIGAATVAAKTVEDALALRGIFLADSEDSSQFEN